MVRLSKLRCNWCNNGKKQYFDESESKTFKLKSELPKLETLSKNQHLQITFGGLIVIGKEDKNLEIRSIN